MQYIIWLLRLCCLLLVTQQSWAAAGDVRLQPTAINVNPNNTFTLELHVDSGTSKLGAYVFNLVFDPTQLQINDSVGDSGITPGANVLSTNIPNLNNTAGTLVIGGFDAVGVTAGTDLHLLTLNFKSLGTAGTSQVQLNVGELENELGSSIGTPNGTGATVQIVLQTYTITPTAGSGGTISPNTPQTVAAGATTQFTLTPNTNYTIASVTGCNGNLSGNIYTTGIITANCTVTATFQPPAPPVCTAAWSPQTSNTANILSSVVWNGSKFLAVGEGGIVLTSPDGINWTSGTTGYTNDLNSITWSGTKFVAVSGVLGKSLIYSSTDGITWTRYISTGNPVLRSVIWNGGLNKLIAVGEQGAILTSSPDAATWTVAQTGKAYTLNSITSTGDLQVAVGTGGTILTSTDGITWTQQTAPTAAVNLLTVIWNGTQFLAAGDKPLILSSSDGITWAKTDITAPANMNFYRIAWNGSRYIAVGSMGLATSNDGQSWTIESTQATDLRDIAWSGSELVAVGDNGIVLRYCISGQLEVITSVSYDDTTPASMPKFAYYGAGIRSTVIDFMVNAKVFATQTGTIDPGGQLSLSLNGTLKATIYDPQIDLIFHNLQTGDVITALYSGTDKYRRSSGSITVGDALTLTVTTSGTGTGTVRTSQTTSPDILCGNGSSNCTQRYSRSTPATVNLIAAAIAGSTFTGWSGDCTGAIATCSVSMTAAKNVNAIFTKNSTPTSYTVTPIIGKGGTVTPSTPQTVTTGTAKSFTVIPKTGYIKSPKGITGTCPLGRWSGNVWTTGNITADCSVNFDFFCLACIPDRGGWRAALRGY